MSNHHDIVTRRLRSMVAESKIGSDAIGKSLRCYQTKVHPVFYERLSVWWEGLNRLSVTEGRTFQYNRDVVGLTGSNLMNYLFQSFYLQEPGAEVDVVYPRLSTKTSVLLTHSESSPMQDELRSWVGQHQLESNYEVVTLRALAEQEIGLPIVRDLLDNTLNSSFSQSVEFFLKSNQFYFPSHEFLAVNDRILQRDLIMKVRYYPSRDDNRAYCSDHNRLRSLVACCLNRMISPKSMAIRRSLHSAKILRPDKKDVLDLHLPLARTEEFRTYLILADISNFTGSFANAWLMVYTMSLEVACGKLEDRYQLFSVGGKLVGASWKELLLLYLYLTVGVPCWIEAQSKFGYLSGGFLGVGGNISLGLLCLAVIVEDLLRRFKKRVFDYRAQAGGDDIAIVIRCPRTREEEIVDQIRFELETYIGKLKELDVYDLEDLPDGVIEEATFCKKRIVLSRDNRGIHLVGEPSVPLPISLLPCTYIRGLRNQIQAWNELDYSLKGYETLMPGQMTLTNTIRQLFLESYRNVKPQRTHSVKHLTGRLRIIQYGKTIITTEAHIEACRVETVEFQGSWALSSYESKVRHALINEYVSLAKVDLGETELSQIVMLQSEIHMLERTQWIERIYLDYDVDLLVELVNIVKAC